MRDNRTPPRGETARVAARVRALLAEAADACADDAGTTDAGTDAGGVDTFAAPALPVTAAAPGRRQAYRYGHDPAPTLWDRVAARVPVRLDPGRRSAFAVGVAVLLAAVVTGIWLMSARPEAVPVSAALPSVPGGALVGTDGVTEGASVPSSAPPTPSPSTAAKLVVDVAGKVRRPGVYRLAQGSRVDDAIQAAGGAVGHVNLSTLNLAAPLVDGQQVAVGVPVAAGGAEVGGSVAPIGDATAPSGTVIDLNSATLEQLETLPGVGPVLGQDILDYRNAHGSFTSIDQLQDVSGIGDVRFGQLKPLVSL